MHTSMTDQQLEEWKDRPHKAAQPVDYKSVTILITELLLWRKAYRRNEKQLTEALQGRLPLE